MCIGRNNFNAFNFRYTRGEIFPVHGYVHARSMGVASRLSVYKRPFSMEFLQSGARSLSAVRPESRVAARGRYRYSNFKVSL